MEARWPRLATKTASFEFGIPRPAKNCARSRGPSRDQNFVIALSPDGRRIGWKSPDGWLIVHDVASGEQLMKAREGGNWSYPAFNRDGTLLASGTGDEIAVWDVASGQRKTMMHGHRGFVQKFEFSPTEPVLASWGSDNTARLWDVETGRELLCLRGHRRPIAIRFRKSRLMPMAPCSPRAVRMRPSRFGTCTPAMRCRQAHQQRRGDNEAAALRSGQIAADYRQELDWLFGHEGP